MRYFIYTIKDELNGFLNVTLDQNDETAERNFTYAIKNDPQMKMFKKDYSLYCIGVYDTDAGIVETCERKLLDANSIQTEE